ncbi:peptidylprolyl isomerase [Roseobacter sp.]|uniref:peptidylprolyl isomerase n=1 Tax=Roseobacter sp. TaxID=1907202 RepID=UPI0025E8A982|nr:peptidylprolyl isomerase [Roseobacter sp.]
MQKHIRFLSGALLALSLSAPAFAQDQTEQTEASAATVVATVNGVDITLGHMIAAAATLPQQYQQLSDDVLYSGILQQLIQQSALSQSFTETLPPRVVYSLENEKRSLVAGEVIENILAGTDVSEDVQALYDEQYGSVEAEDEYNASHILVETEEAALEVLTSLDEGADFAETAKEKSTGPSGPGGGELGWFGSGAMVPEFEAAVIALEEGEVSSPVQTQFGWHVIRLNEVRKADVPTLDDVRTELESQARRTVAEAAIERFSEEAEVLRPEGDPVDPALLRRIDLLE